ASTHALVKRAEVPHLHRHKRSGPIPWTDGRVDAAADATRRDPRSADHDTFSISARRARAHRQAGDDRHQGYYEARLWRRRRGTRQRVAGVLGLWRDATIGNRDDETGVLHHALSRRDAGDRSAQHRVRDFVTTPRRARSYPADPPRSRPGGYARLRRARS